MPYCRAKVHSLACFNSSLCSDYSSAPQSPKKGTDPHASESSCITAGSRGRRRQRRSPPRRGVSFLRVGIPSPRFPGRKTLRDAKVLYNGVSRAGMQEVGAGGTSQGPLSKEDCLQETLTATSSSRLQGPQALIPPPLQTQNRHPRAGALPQVPVTCGQGRRRRSPPLSRQPVRAGRALCHPRRLASSIPSCSAAHGQDGC